MTNQERTNRKRLRGCLESMFRHLDRYYSINFGGCCWVTYCLAYNFERLNIKYDLVIYEQTDLPEQEIYDIIKCKRIGEFGTGTETCYHYTLKVSGMGILNKGDDSFVVIHNINSSDIKWIYEYGSWNSCYNSRLNDIIKNFIDSTFKIYEEETGKTAA